MTSSNSIIYPIPPVPNKRGQGLIGGDLIVTYCSDLAQCELLQPGSRYINSGNFKAGSFLLFHQPSFILDLYPHLLSTDDDEAAGLPILLSMFNTEAKDTTLEHDWEGKWFSIVARLCPNKLTFHGIRLENWDAEETQSVQVSLALPRDGGLTPIVPRLFSNQHSSNPWPTSSAHVSFAGPVDLDTFRLKQEIWTSIQRKTTVFVKLGTYLMPENDRPPHKGIHICHVLLIFPLEQQPWTSLVGWMRESQNPFPKGSWIVASGRILGVLNRELLVGPNTVDSTVRILAVLPDNWEFIRQSSFSTPSTSSPASKKPITELPTPPRPIGPGGVTSWNPFSSPVRGKQSIAQRPPSPKPETQFGQVLDVASTKPRCELMSTKEKEPDTCTDSVLQNSDSGTHYASSDDECLLEDQFPSTNTTPTRKRKHQASPDLNRSTRSTTVGKRTRHSCL